MRRPQSSGLTSHVIAFIALMLLGQGCAGPILHTSPASEQEAATVSEIFARFQQLNNELCGCCLDAEADVVLSVSGWFRDHAGRLTGYLQAMEPDHLRFVAINPLGQPLFLFATDGKIFKCLDVLNRRAYLGSVNSEAYRKFSPSGFEPKFSYYWLTGRLEPGELPVDTPMRAAEQGNFWLKIGMPDSNTQSMVLFDPENMVILRHVILDERGELLIDVNYSEHRQLPGTKESLNEKRMKTGTGSAGVDGKCKVPARITVASKAGTEKIVVELRSFLADTHLSAADFHLDIPNNFEQLLVK